MPPSEQSFIRQEWGEIPLEVLCYFMIVGIVYLLVFVVGCLGVCVAHQSKWDVLRRRIGRFAAFLGILLMVGAFFDVVWYLLIFGRLYLSLDPCLEFVPFFPITESKIEAPFGQEPWGDTQGHLLGDTTYPALFFLWALFAFATWGSTIFFYRRFFCVYGKKPQQP